jgi:hypothetical protein
VFALNNGTDVKLNGTVDLVGNAYLYAGSVMTLVGNPNVNGILFHDSASSVVKNSSNATDQLMSATDLALRAKIFQLATAAGNEMATQSPDMADPAIRSISSSQVYVADPAKEVNVISAENVSLGSGHSLTFVGDPKSIFIFKISGAASFGDGIELEGVAANHLLIYITNEVSTSGVVVGGSAGVAGTFLAPGRTLKFSGQGSFRGALISGASGSPAITLGGNGGGTAADFEADAFCTKVMTQP